MDIFTIIKYIISGGTAALVDLISLHFLDNLGIHYILSVNIAFIIAFGVSFSLQKYWTFKDADHGKTHHQALMYLIVSIINVFINTTIIHLLLSSNIVNGFLFLKPVVIAQIISGIIVAIESFFIYRLFIFKRNDSSVNTIDFKYNLRKIFIIILFTIGIIFLLYFSLSNLTESPPTWMDEGIIIQTARNLSVSGYSGIRIDPQTIVSSGYVTTSYPVTLPIAISFDLFANDLFHARIVMVIFIILLIIFSLLWFRKSISNNIWISIITLFLIITFPPLYGHGKNVLGEIPGLFFLFLSMLSLEFTYRIYIDPVSTNKRKIFNTIITSLLIGIVVVTKPIFILILPAFFIVLIYYLYKNKIFILNNKKIFIINFLFGLIAFIIPIFLWIIFQFHGESLGYILSIYANPHSTDLTKSIILNMKRFITEVQPIYTLILTLVWTLVLYIRIKRKDNIKLSEIILFIFNILIILAYLRTVGYYRYFFLGEFITIIMLPYNLYYLSTNILNNNKAKILSLVIVIILIIMQFYQLVFGSWISHYKNSDQSKSLENFIREIPSNKEIFVYQAPELVTFIKSENYSQFMDITETIKVGEKSLNRITNKLSDIIAINSNPDYIKSINELSHNGYVLYNSIGKYQFLKKK